MIPFLLLFLASLSHSLVVSDQEAGFLDLTEGIVGHRIHQPTFGSGGGISGVTGDGPRVEHRKEPLRITLLSLDRTSYRIGEDLTYELKIENVGTEAQLFPWDPNVADVEPKNPSQPYEYQSLDISLWFRNQVDQVEALRAASLYATSEKEASRLELKPGQWVRIRGKVRLSFRDHQFKDTIISSPTSEIRAVATLSFYRAKVSVRNSDYNEEMNPEGPPRSSVDPKRFTLVNSSSPD
jgi:hypothetical protein